MSAGDVQFVGWTGGDPLYKELRPTIQYEPIQRSNANAEENPNIEKRVTRNLLCFEKDRDTVLSQLLKSGENLKSVYIDTDGSSKELDFGPQWELLSVSEAPQAIGFIRISAQYKKEVSKVLEVDRPLGFNVYYPSKGIAQFRYKENVLEEFNTDYGDLKFNYEAKYPESFWELARVGNAAFIRRTGSFIGNGIAQRSFVVTDDIDKTAEHAYAQIITTNEFYQQVELERFSISIQDAINYKSEKVIHLDSVEIINSSTESSLGIVSGSRDRYRGIPNNLSFLYLEREEKNNRSKIFGSLGLNFTYDEARDYAQSQLLSEDDVQFRIDEWNSQEDGNYAVHEKSAGVVRRTRGGVTPPENVPFWVEAIYKYKKPADQLDIDKNLYRVNWTRENNIIRLNVGPFVWKEYDVTGLT